VRCIGILTLVGAGNDTVMRTGPISNALLASLAVAALFGGLAGCGGGNRQSVPPPTPDFTISVSPTSASGTIGNMSSTVTVSVTPQNGFNGSVNVTLQRLPSGVSSSPGSPFAVQSGASQAVVFSISGSSTVGVFQLTVAGTSGAKSHNTQLVLTTEPIVHVNTYQSGSVLYLESDSGTDTSRIGLQTMWGGSIVEVSLNGTNFVNEHDTGREVQAAQYDGNAQYDNCAGCTGTFGWNPVQGGDKYDQGSPVLVQTLMPDSLYIKVHPYQWNPDDKGGGPGQPVLGDTYVEATISAVTDHAFTFKVHYKITHFGTDQHADSIQEFPAVYVNLGFDRFVSDSGTIPWANASITFVMMPQLPQGSPTIYASEQWGAFVDNNDQGLTVFVPGMAPYIGGFSAAGDPGPTGFGTNYFAPRTFFSFGPGSVLEGDVYLVAGDYKHARQVIYDLHNRLAPKDIFTPFGSVDSPVPKAQLSGAINVAGWALDDVAVAKVDVSVDGVLIGTATYGGSRPDVANDLPNAPASIGYIFSLDTTKFSNGPHTIQVSATDTSGNVAVFPNVPVTLQN
jgi:Bacterial Ig domain